MSSTSPDPDDYDIDLLEHHLSSLDLPDEAMLLGELDGYLTAIAIAPRIIQPSEWLGEIWGGIAPPFAADGEAGAALDAILGLYNDILRMLADERTAFEPLFMIDRDGSILVEIWADGFIRGVALRLDDWAPLIDDDAMGAAFLSIASVSHGPDGRDMPGFSEKQRAHVLRSGPRMFPKYVAQMHAFWRSRGLGPMSPPPPRTGPSPRKAWLAHAREAHKEFAANRSVKAGRNDPCPCGSGKKFKRCCGA